MLGVGVRISTPSPSSPHISFLFSLMLCVPAISPAALAFASVPRSCSGSLSFSFRLSPFLPPLWSRSACSHLVRSFFVLLFPLLLTCPLALVHRCPRCRLFLFGWVRVICCYASCTYFVMLSCSPLPLGRSWSLVSQCGLGAECS